MPKELPGFYYDAKKNRYFPKKGSIPGSSSRIKSSNSSSSSSLIEPSQTKVPKRLGTTTAKLLQTRELFGNVITSVKGKYNFREEYTKRQVSEPTIWRYSETDTNAYYALEQLEIDTDMPDGNFTTDLVISGGLNNSLSFYVVDKDTQEFHYGVRSSPDCAWPLDIENRKGFAKSPGHLWKLSGYTVGFFSSISCIKKCGKPGLPKILISTLGSHLSGGAVYMLSLSQPLVLRSGIPMIGDNMEQIASYRGTVWTADCSSDGSKVFIGTNLGAALVNVETRTQSWVCRCKSDVFSVQLDHSERIALCGLRNGAIVTVDVRQRPDSYARLTRQRILLHSERSGTPSRSNTDTKHWFEVRGNINPSDTVSMPSSVSCLASLKLYDQYFLASSMDGSIKLYDHRMAQRGAVQSFEGSVNSHTRIQLGVDPSERYVMSGGEDCKLRLWSIKSGELLFEEKFTSSVPSVVCWNKKEDNYARDGCIDNEHSLCGEAWIGSGDGLFHMRW